MNAEKWEELAVLVAAGQTVRDAAASLGMPEKTAYSYSARPEFKAWVNQSRTEVIEQASGKLANAVHTAVETLEDLCVSAEKDSDRINAAKAIIANMLPISENMELRKRLDDLERRAMESAGEAGEQPAKPE